MNPADVTLIMDIANKLSIEMTELAITILESSLKKKRHEENMERLNNGESIQSVFGNLFPKDQETIDLQKEEQIYEAESDAREEEKELLNDESND